MRIEQLTFTRFLASIAIVIFHFGRNIFPFNSDEIRFLFDQSNVGVSYFFILSGFVMTIVYYNKNPIDIKTYYTKRVARIYPLYLFALILTTVLFIIKQIPFDATSFFLNIVALQSWLPGKALTLNYPGWSLSVEFLFYLLFLLIFSKLKIRSLSSAILTVLSIWLITQIVFLLVVYNLIRIPFYSTIDLLYMPIFHINEFVVGIVTGLVFLKYKKFSFRNSINTILITINIGMIIVALKIFDNNVIHNGLLAVLFSPLIFLISKNTGKLTKFFSNKVFVFLGEISFGIYLLQVPVYMLVPTSKFGDFFNIKNDSLLGLVTFFIPFLLLILLSSFTFKYIETPMRKLIQDNFKS